MRVLWGLAVAAALGVPVIVASEEDHGDRHADHPEHAGAGDVCATGCAAASYATPELPLAEYELLLAAAADGEWSADNAALETLLFHGAAASQLAREHGTGLLDEERLLAELGRTHATLNVRLVGEDGAERVRLAPSRVPLGEKQHLFPEHATGVQVPEISGTVKRVGLHHLWTRL